MEHYFDENGENERKNKIINIFFKEINFNNISKNNDNYYNNNNNNNNNENQNLEDHKYDKGQIENYFKIGWRPYLFNKTKTLSNENEQLFLNISSDIYSSTDYIANTILKRNEIIYPKTHFIEDLNFCYNDFSMLEGCIKDEFRTYTFDKNHNLKTIEEFINLTFNKYKM